MMMLNRKLYDRQTLSRPLHAVVNDMACEDWRTPGRVHIGAAAQQQVCFEDATSIKHSLVIIDDVFGATSCVFMACLLGVSTKGVSDRLVENNPENVDRWHTRR
jgi:hypothetical protein